MRQLHSDFTTLTEA